MCTAVIIFDVLSRKFGFQIPGMGSTRLQELEWHLYTALFSFWLGVGYIKNTHVRIDIALAKARPRTHAWIELLGCLVFALPYCLIAIYFSYDFACHLVHRRRALRIGHRPALPLGAEGHHLPRAGAAARCRAVGADARDRVPVRPRAAARSKRGCRGSRARMSLP